MQLLTSVLAAAVLATSVVAHPGHDHHAEMAERAAFTKHSKRDLSHCAAKIEARGLEQRAIARRALVARQARQKRSLYADAPFLHPRADDPLNTSHESSESYTSDAAESTIFASNSSCILSPELAQGPYYVSGEHIRKDVTESQAGVSMILDTQILDLTTCEPVTNAVIEIWNCNSTGVYSGIVASGNGVGTADPSNLNNTFLRGLQATDEDGVAQFETLFPGHYTRRTTHTHVMVHFNGTQFENGTYSGGYVSHVGQLFYDQDLITQVSTASPYDSNSQDLTTNAEDPILLEDVANGHDPFVEYSFLGDSVEDGIFAWISFGVDLTQQETVTGAATLTENGGEANADSGMGGGSGGPGGNGTTGGAPPGFNGTTGTPPVSNRTVIGNGTTLVNGTTGSGNETSSVGSGVTLSGSVSSGLVFLIVVLGVF